MKTKTPLDTVSDFMAFCTILGIRQNEAMGILDRLYRFTAKVAYDGFIGEFYDCASIEKHVGWHGAPGQLITALMCSDFLYVHKWKKSKDRCYAVSYWDSLVHVYCPDVEG